MKAGTKNSKYIAAIPCNVVALGQFIKVMIKFFRAASVHPQYPHNNLNMHILHPFIVGSE